MVCAPSLKGEETTIQPGVFKNGGFEETSNAPPKGVSRFFCKDWTVVLNGGAARCDAELSEDAYEGKYAMKFITKAPMAGVAALQTIDASPGQEVSASVYAKGTKGAMGFLRFHILDAEGKQMKQYFSTRINANETWRPLKLRFTVPEGVTRITATVQTALNKEPIEIYFDKFEATVTSGSTLENSLLRIQINPLVGGCIDSMIVKKKSFEYTLPHLPNATGGMALDIIPGNRYPGLVKLEKYDIEVVTPYREIRVFRTFDTEEYKGLRIQKTFRLDEGASFVSIAVELSNPGDKPIECSYRIQNCLKPDDGIFTWPTADWLQAFRKTSESVREINSIVTDNLRAGWCAKRYDALEQAILFTFSNSQVYRSYNWISEPFDTVEWYYRDIKLSPGETWKTEYTIAALPSQQELYSDGLDNRVEYVRGVRLPEPEKGRKLPEIMRGYFPFGASASALVDSVSAGGSKNMFRYSYSRQLREMAHNYCNFLFSFRMIQIGYQEEFVNNDNTFELGELARKYSMMLAPSHLVIGKNDIDIEKFRPALAKKIDYYYNAITRKFITDYQDRILAFFTADEIQTHNIPCMLEAHDTLNKIVPDRAYFPYLNMPTLSYIPYVPVFLGDWYPIKRSGWGERDPWSTARVVATAVKQAGDSPPVWFMPQGFGYRHTGYALPTSAEMRLMLYLAVANGAKGIVFHGINNPGLSWRVKYGYHYSIYGNAGERTEAWSAIGDCARELTATGPLFCDTNPEWDFFGAEVTCAQFKDSKGFYNGPAITIHSLARKSGSGRFFIVINQDTGTKQTGTISLGQELKKSVLYDITEMKEIDASRSLSLSLSPGDARIYFLGTQEEVEAVASAIYGNRYIREQARYIIEKEYPSANGEIVQPAEILFQQASDFYASGKNESAYQTLLRAQKTLRETLSQSALGKTLTAMESSRKLFDTISFLFSSHFDLLMSPELEKEAPRFRVYKNSKDPTIQKLVDAVAQDISTYWRLEREIREGKYAKVRKEVEELIARIPVNVKNASDYLYANAHTIKVDDPYQ